LVQKIALAGVMRGLGKTMLALNYAPTHQNQTRAVSPKAVVSC